MPFGERIAGQVRDTPFDGLGSSREHKCEKNSLHLRGIAMGLRRGWRGGGGGSVPPVFPGSAYA